MYSRNVLGSGNLKHIQSVHIDEYFQNSHDLHSCA